MVNKVYLTKEEFNIQNEELGVNLPFDDNLAVLGEECKIGEKTIANRLDENAEEVLKSER